MKMNMLERFMTLDIIPNEGNFATLSIVRNLKNVLPPTEKEIQELGIKTGDNGITVWNNKGKEEKEIPISDIAALMIKDRLKQLDKQEKLKEQHYTLYEKFFKEGEK
jgi:hypothetical protein